MPISKSVRTCGECIPCFMRQALEAVALTRQDLNAGENLYREILGVVAARDWNVSPPVVSQQIQRLIRKRTGCVDPYREMKSELNRMALDLVPEIKARIPTGMSEQEAVVRMAIGGNILDAGAKSGLQMTEAMRTLGRLIEQPLDGDWPGIFSDAESAGDILYLTDNAGEIVFDRCLLEKLPPGKLTVAVRGGPVINDATLEDAKAAGLDDLARVISNGSDAPGTILEDCSPAFREVFKECDLIIAKGQGNYETLNSTDKPSYFLFQVKCQVIAKRVGAAVGTMVVRNDQGRQAGV